MIEELLMAVLMSIAFALPVYYICDLHGSFFLVWLVWLVSLADGIGASFSAGHHMTDRISIPLLVPEASISLRLSTTRSGCFTQ